MPNTVPGHFCTVGVVNLEDGRCPHGTYSTYYSLANVSQYVPHPLQPVDEILAS